MKQKTERNAYKPRKPFKAIEGVGTRPWMRLSRNSVYVLNRFYAKFNGYNRDNLSLTYKEMNGKLSGRLFTAALWELMSFGFIDRVRSGRLEKECSIYRLSNRWRKFEDKEETLNEIELRLGKIEELRRKKGSLEKRTEMNKLRNEALRVSGAKKT